MLFATIRLINDGDALDEVSLNRFAYDIQANLEEIFRILGEIQDTSGTADLIPDTLVQRDTNGTAKFGTPTEPEHPVRLADAGTLIPTGLISMWSGSIASIPEGWALCNGSNGTPDLRDRFIVGAGSSYSVGNKGGAKEVTLTIAEMPAHDHPGTTQPAGRHRHREGGKSENPMFGYWKSDNGMDNDSSGVYPYTDYAPDHTHGLDIQNRGGSQPHENRPPYYALAFIMKL